MDNNMETIRLELALTRRELATLSDVCEITLGRIAKGESCKDLTKAKIAKALGKTKEEVFPTQPAEV